MRRKTRKIISVLMIMLMIMPFTWQVFADEPLPEDQETPDVQSENMQPEPPAAEAGTAVEPEVPEVPEVPVASGSAEPAAAETPEVPEAGEPAEPDAAAAAEAVCTACSAFTGSSAIILGSIGAQQGRSTVASITASIIAVSAGAGFGPMCVRCEWPIL